VRAESRYRGERRCNLGDGSWIEQTVGVVFGQYFAFQGGDDEALILSAKPKRSEAVSVRGHERIHRRRLSRIEVRNSRPGHLVRRRTRCWLRIDPGVYLPDSGTRSGTALFAGLYSFVAGPDFLSPGVAQIVVHADAVSAGTGDLSSPSRSAPASSRVKASATPRPS